MTTLFLLRHGETEWNSDGNRYCGRTDIALSEQGRKQAGLAAAALAGEGIEALYCSPLRRSLETAQRIGDALGLRPVVDDRLNELDFGLWEGKTSKEIEAEDGDGWREWLSFPETTRAGRTGHSASEVFRRADAFFAETFQSGGRCAVVGHNTLNRIYLAGMLGLSLSGYRRLVQHNAGITVLEAVDGEPCKLVRLNETAHLR